MKKYLVAVIFLASLACQSTYGTAVKVSGALGNLPDPAPTPPLSQIVVRVERVNIRDAESHYFNPPRYAFQGDTFSGYCKDQWCYIGAGQKIWRACTNWKSKKYEVCQ